MLLLNQGMHATAEIVGCFAPTDNFVWKKAVAWIDKYLKGDNKNLNEQPIVIQKRKIGFMPLDTDRYF